MRRAPRSPSSSESTKVHQAESGLEILLVDDHLPWLRTASDTFGRDGFHVVATLSAGAAVELLRRGLRPAIVVITTRMASATADIGTEIRLLSPATDVMVLPVPQGSEATRSLCTEIVAHTCCGCADRVSEPAA
jgi:CheY-like chemotaxis protein